MSDTDVTRDAAIDGLIDAAFVTDDAPATGHPTPIRLLKTDDFSDWYEALPPGDQALVDRAQFRARPADVVWLDDADQVIVYAGWDGRDNLATLGRLPMRLPEGEYAAPANATALALFGALGIGPGDSLLDLLMRDDMPGLIDNWPEVAHSAANRLRTESAAMGGIAAFDPVIRHLSAVPRPSRAPPAPVIPTIIRLGDTRLSMFATIAQFGTPEDLTLDDLKVELYFPMDDITKAAFEQMERAQG